MIYQTSYEVHINLLLLDHCLENWRILENKLVNF